MTLFPSVVIDDASNVFQGDAIFMGKFALQNVFRRISSANFRDLSVSQLSIAARLAMSVSAFCVHIREIILRRSDKQMAGIATGWGIATMAQNTWRVFAISKQPRDAVGAQVLPFRAGLDLPVSFAVSRPAPKPTIVRAAAINFFPKSFSQWALRSRLMAADVFALPTRKFRLGDWLTAATGTELGCSFGRGMIAHVISSLSASGRTGGDSQSLPGVSIGLSNSSIAQVAKKRKALEAHIQ